MRTEDRRYKNGMKERMTVYDVNDLANCDKVLLFQGDSRWSNFKENYKSYLTKGKFSDISHNYRGRLKVGIALKITKMYFKMLFEDILKGHKVRIGRYQVYIYIGNRKMSSKKLKAKRIDGIEYIPYIQIPRSITIHAFGMYYINFTDFSKRKFASVIHSGKKYKLNNGF